MDFINNLINNVFGSWTMAFIVIGGSLLILLYVPWNKLPWWRKSKDQTTDTPTKSGRIPAIRRARFKKFPWWAQLLIYFPSIWKFWIPVFPTILGSVTLPLVQLNHFFFLLFVLGAAITAIYYYTAFEIIEESVDGEPRFGLLEVLGTRFPYVADEGLRMKIPLISRFVLRSKEQFNDDITIESTKCRLERIEGSTSNTFYGQVAHAMRTPSPPDIKSGGSVETKLGVTFERDWSDGWSVLEYDDIGETRGFKDIIRDTIEEDMREVGRRLTWLQAMFATDLASAHIVTRLTGNEMFEGKNIFDDPTPESIANFLRHVTTNGVSYIGGLGVNIRRVQVKSVDPIGKLKEASDLAAIEEMRRVGLLKNVDALVDAAKKLQASIDDESMSWKDIINTIQVDEEGSRVEKKIIEIAANDIDKLAEVLKIILSSKK